MDKDLITGFVVDVCDRMAVYEITKDIDLIRPALNDTEAVYQELKENYNPFANPYTLKEKAFINCFDCLKSAFDTGYISSAARAELFNQLDIISSGLVL